MSFDLGFLDEALKEWRKLDRNTREQFKAKLAERLTNPRVPAAKLGGHRTATRSSCAAPVIAWCMRCATVS